MQVFCQIQNDSDIWIKIIADVSGLNFSKEKEEDEILDRFVISGNLIFIDKLDVVKNLTRKFTNIRFYRNGYLIGKGSFNLFQNIDFDYKRYTFKITATDEYSKIIDNKEEKYNILNSAHLPAYQNLEYIADSIEYEYRTVTYDRHLTFDYNLGNYEYAFDITRLDAFFVGSEIDPTEWTNLSSSFNVIDYVNCLAMIFTIRGTGNFIREVKISIYNADTPIVPGGAGWYFAEDVYISGIKYPKYARALQVADVNVFSGDPIVYQGCSRDATLINPNYTNNLSIPTASPITYVYDRIRRVDTIIEYIIGEIDDSILFDNTGTDTDSFYGFKYFEGESITTYGDTEYTSNKPFENLLIMQITDFMLTDGGAVTTEFATRGMLNFNSLMSKLKFYGFYWFLEYRDGLGYFFKLLHKTQISKVEPNPLSYSYFQRKRQYEYNEFKYSNLKNGQICNSVDFIGTNALFTNVIEKRDFEVADNNIFTDINDINIRKGDIYSRDSIIDFVFISAITVKGTTPLLDYFTVRKATGLITNIKTNNSELGFANITENLICELPDATCEVNNKTIEIDIKRIKKRKKITLNIPIKKSINLDFDFDKYVLTPDGVSEIENYSHKALENNANLKLIL